MKTTLFVFAVVFIYAFSLAGKDPSPKPATEERRIIAEGVTYTHSYYAKSRWSVHTLVVDLKVPGTRLHVIKGLENIAGLERVGDIAKRFDSLNARTAIFAGVNANFWKAGTNHPMGPTVSNGEILKARKYKNWSSIAVTESGNVLMDNFDIQAAIKTKYGEIEIDKYNLRTDSLSVVIYNRYFGSTVPFIDTLGIVQASKDTITDDSEVENIVAMAIDSLWGSIQEAGMLKMQYEYVSKPKANTITTCRVTGIDTGIVAIPRNGGIISFGRGSFPLFFSLFVGDTFSLVSRVYPEINEPVLQMAGGSPRLVRDGNVSVEWSEEGLRKKRFVMGNYGRSSIGISKDGSKLILITVEPYHRGRTPRTRGISLPSLAELQVKNGAYHAINFDGGSSATMVVGGVAVSNNGNPYTRKISTAFLVGRETVFSPQSPKNQFMNVK